MWNLGISSSMVHNIIKRFRESQEITACKRQGRKPTLNARDLRSHRRHCIKSRHQRVWSEKDYLFLRKKLASSHVHSHYFKSGVIGSGLAIFSKHRIQDTLLYRYSLNGYPYMAHHGDWFGGKAVGLAVVNIGTLTANFYLTHLHAEYCRERDAYLPHRVVQSWELQQFIRHTSAGADVVVLGGDLNMHPQDLGNKLLTSYTGLRDAYTETDAFDGCEDGLTLILDNPFISQKVIAPFKKGIRIDYILFKGSSKANIQCASMCTTKGSVLGKAFPYSDHEALTAEFRLDVLAPSEAGGDFRTRSHDCAGGDVARLVDILTEARTEVKVGVHCAERMRYTAARTGAMGLALLLLELAIAAVPWLALGAEQAFPLTSFCLLAALCFAILLCTSLLYVFYSMELKSLQGTEDQMRLAVGGLQEKLRGFPVAKLPGCPQPSGGLHVEE
ncbi:sphingomyelin phosphodiesterase 2 isoform X2 [Phyllopteryx taeniolatus]|uniref:sphingomyelin phosphodiesterase 2 isoform X2 n=1 Tax=Phyllopteryx taeniolatus TaxID=161469 RepID=UPI002AD4A728|nr:sphingomyelin phosphodiesterase 2 isoform X2 [Phyllopteryx taeniolatus]